MKRTPHHPHATREVASFPVYKQSPPSRCTRVHFAPRARFQQQWHQVGFDNITPSKHDILFWALSGLIKHIMPRRISFSVALVHPQVHGVGMVSPLFPPSTCISFVYMLRQASRSCSRPSSTPVHPLHLAASALGDTFSFPFLSPLSHRYQDSDSSWWILLLTVHVHVDWEVM